MEPNETMQRSERGRFSGLSYSAVLAAGREQPAQTLLRFGGARGDATVLRPGEEGAARLAVHDRDLVAPVEVEDVVAAGAPGRGIEHEVASEADAARRRRVAVGITELRVGLDALLPAALDLGHLFGGEHGLEPLRPLDGRDRPVRPVPLQVRPPVRRARHRPAVLRQREGGTPPRRPAPPREPAPLRPLLESWSSSSLRPLLVPHPKSSGQPRHHNHTAHWSMIHGFRWRCLASALALPRIDIRYRIADDSELSLPRH